MSNGIIRHLQRIVASAPAAEEAPARIIDLNPDDPDWKKVTRIVREHCHIGNAGPGDRVRVSESELAQAPIAYTLLTEEEHDRIEKQRAAAMLKLLTGEREPTPEQRKTDEVLNREREQRAERELYERGALDAEVARARDR